MTFSADIRKPCAGCRWSFRCPREQMHRVYCCACASRIDEEIAADADR